MSILNFHLPLLLWLLVVSNHKAYAFIFNAALSFHLCAMNPDKEPHGLQKALKLYKMVVSLS